MKKRKKGGGGGKREREGANDEVVLDTHNLLDLGKIGFRRSFTSFSISRSCFPLDWRIPRQLLPLVAEKATLAAPDLFDSYTVQSQRKERTSFLLSLAKSPWMLSFDPACDLSSELISVDLDWKTLCPVLELRGYEMLVQFLRKRHLHPLVGRV